MSWWVVALLVIGGEGVLVSIFVLAGFIYFFLKGFPDHR